MPASQRKPFKSTQSKTIRIAGDMMLDALFPILLHLSVPCCFLWLSEKSNCLQSSNLQSKSNCRQSSNLQSKSNCLQSSNLQSENICKVPRQAKRWKLDHMLSVKEFKANSWLRRSKVRGRFFDWGFGSSLLDELLTFSRLTDSIPVLFYEARAWPALKSWVHYKRKKD